MRIGFGGSVFILDKHKKNKWFLFKKFGYIAYVVDTDINCIRTIPDSNLIQLSLKRKVIWYNIDNYRPNLEQFKKIIL